MTPLKPRIISFGEIIWDVYETESLIGGAPLNFAAHCSGCGAESFLISAVGQDALGSMAFERIPDFGINSRFVKRTSSPTGQCIVTLSDAGIPNYNVLSSTAYDSISLSDEDIAAISALGFDALYFGTLIQRSAASRSSLHRLCAEVSFREIICDINLRNCCYNADSAAFCLENATILKISQEEEPLLQSLGLYTTASSEPECIAKAICSKFRQIKYLILTLGENGAFVYSAADTIGFTEAAKRVPVVSTVGAGDSFTAAWVCAYLSGKSVQEATHEAVALSAFVVSQADAIPDRSTFSY